MSFLRGTDISAYQGSIPAGDFCIEKATEGLGYNDPPFAARWKTLAQRGTLRGAYHFAHTGDDPVAEADHFLSIVTAAGLKPGDWLVLDHETPGSSPSHDAAWAVAWCKHVQAKTGVRPVVYTFLSFAQEGRCAGLGGYPLWIADPSSPAGHPRVPAPWTSWAMHQYGSPGGVDVDVFNGDKAAWLALGGGHTPTPTPTPTPTTPQETDMPNGQLKDGANAKDTISWPKGQCKGAIGFLAEPGASAALHVQVHDAKGWGPVSVHTAAATKAVVHFTDPATTDGVSVVRADTGAATVGYDAS
jgi:GH25 family lysozyme M1 (1,4-beta-N-acetylmuramidase)